MGPRLKGTKEDLLLMEEVKLRCMLSLIHRAGQDSEGPHYLENCCRVIWDLDGKIRASYVADINHIKTHDLAKIMLVDGCFLLELLISKGSRLNNELRCRLTSPPPAPQVLQNEDVLSDLILFENQIPMCVLLELSGTLFPNVFEEDSPDTAIRINNLALSIFGYNQLPPDHQTFEAPHILDVVHFSVNTKKESKTTTDHDQKPATNGNDQALVDTITDICPDDTDDTDEEQINPMLKLERCAWRLQAAGVTIKLPPNPAEDTITDTDSCFSTWIRKNWNCFVGTILMKRVELDIPAAAARKKLRGLDIQFEFKEGKLEIKQLHITETTKVMWRNFIAWEHHKNKTGTYFGFRKVGISRGKFTTAALIFNDMICCAADVRLLKDKNIIVDHVKNRSDEELVAFIRTLPFGVDHGVVDAEYVKMVDDLNNYSESCFISRMYKLFWHVLQRLVTFMHRDYNFVAALLALLTVVQTLLAILDYFRN